MRRIRFAILLSSMSVTAAAASAMQLNDAAAPTSPAISKLTTAHLVTTTHINIPADEFPTARGTSARVVLHVDLDATGTPTAIRVVQPLSPEVDARVVEGVRHFRWTPAVLNNQPVPTDLTLTVEVQR